MNSILIVEDDETDQFITQRMISKVFPTANIHVAFDGVEALEYLNNCEQYPDAILLDINMPRMNGHEFLAEVAKLNPKLVPVICMLTSSDQEVDKSKSMLYEFVKGYFIKPITADDIAQIERMTR